MFRKLLAVLMVCLVLTGSAALAQGVSGTFSGTARGMNGDVEVALTLENGKITGVSIEGAAETAGIGDKAIEQLTNDIAASASIAVDTLSGATVTSNAILQAATAALTSAGLNPQDYQTRGEA